MSNLKEKRNRRSRIFVWISIAYVEIENKLNMFKTIGLKIRNKFNQSQKKCFCVYKLNFEETKNERTKQLKNNKLIGNQLDWRMVWIDKKIGIHSDIIFYCFWKRIHSYLTFLKAFWILIVVYRCFILRTCATNYFFLCVHSRVNVLNCLVIKLSFVDGTWLS